MDSFAACYLISKGKENLTSSKLVIDFGTICIGKVGWWIWEMQRTCVSNMTHICLGKLHFKPYSLGGVIN